MSKGITTKRLIQLMALGSLMGVVSAVAISYFMTREVFLRIDEREVEALFSAVEAGPVGFLTTHAAKFADEQLSAMMGQMNPETRGIVGVSVSGGQGGSEKYLSWSDPKLLEISAECISKFTKVVTPASALFPFQIQIETNACLRAAERWRLWRWNAFMVILCMAISFVAVFLASSAVWRSIQKARKVLSEKTKIDPKGIPFIPIRELVIGAMRAKELEGVESIGRMAAQVAHDIRSPVAALDMLVSELELPEDNRLILRSAVARIKDIASDLVSKGSPSVYGAPSGDEPTLQMAVALVEDIVSEKRLQHRARTGIEIEIIPAVKLYGIFINVDPGELKRVISNLINNAVEAIETSGKILTAVEKKRGSVQICICDTGKGIPEDLLPKLAERGTTFGKAGGSGLGLYHAKTTIESWGGKLEISSKVGDGTEVVVTLPEAPAPPWFTPHIILKKGQTVVIVDDDDSIHRVWESRLVGVSLRHVHTPRDLEACIATISPSEPVLYLCDCEFAGDKTTGLELIEKLHIEAQSILVTSKYDEPEVQAECIRLLVGLLPKRMAGFVPVQFS